MHRKNILLTISLVITVACFYLIYSNTRHNNNFTCQGKVNAFKGESSYSARDLYTFSNGAGEIKTVGVYKNNSQEKIIAYKLKFKYDKNGDEFNMSSTYSSIKSADANLLNELIPDFFLYKDRGFRMILSLNKKDTYVFSTLEVPFFICTKMNHESKSE